jgi:predicted RNase H-related nuclease YkuK (DUF458 family)
VPKRYDKDYFKKLKEQSFKYYDSIPALNWGEMVGDKYIINDRYDFRWRAEIGENKSLVPVSNVEEHILNFINDEKEKSELSKINRDIFVYMGTDSQNHLSYTRFVSTIVLYVERNGAHVLLSKTDLPKIYDYRYRLLKETDITVEMARNYEQLFKKLKLKYELHSDYNQSTNHKSNGVVMEASNFAKHLGFDIKIKPNSWAATYAADHFCK